MLRRAAHRWPLLIACCVLLVAIFEIRSAAAEDPEREIEVCNRTPFTLSVAFAYDDAGEIVSSGWLIAPASLCVTLETDDPVIGDYYLHAHVAQNDAIAADEGRLGAQWGTTHEFCTRAAPFVIREATGQCIDDGSRKFNLYESDRVTFTHTDYLIVTLAAAWQYRAGLSEQRHQASRGSAGSGSSGGGRGGSGPGCLGARLLCPDPTAVQPDPMAFVYELKDIGEIARIYGLYGFEAPVDIVGSPDAVWPNCLSVGGCPTTDQVIQRFSGFEIDQSRFDRVIDVYEAPRLDAGGIHGSGLTGGDLINR